MDNDEFAAQLVLGAAVAAKALGPGAQIKAVRLPSTYMTAALTLGYYSNDVKRYQEGLDFLDRGLALQPGNATLSNEKCASLEAMGRSEDVLAVAQPLLVSPLTSNTQKASLYRKVGFAYTELTRLDDAEAAYNASLKLDPNNAGSKSELAYIAKLRGGALGDGGSVA